MKTKIIIAGIGGVGGYFGGLLAKHFCNDANVEIYFVARGRHLKEIQTKGLKVINGESEFIARPALATYDPTEIGIANFIIVATKSYDLESMIQQLQPCINQDTIVLPLLNGVDSKDRIKNILPDNIVLDGCVYIVSRLKEPGVIENTGNIQTLYFGLDNFANDRLLLLEKIFKAANIDATLSQNISTFIWEKFIFISPTATATSYFNNSIGELLADGKKLATIIELVEEVRLIAQAKEIVIPDHITEKTLNRLKALPFEATSSLHSDFKSNKPKNELGSLTGYVVDEGRKYNIETPVYLKTYNSLNKINIQVFFHGTKAALKPGDLIGAGYKSNYGQQKKASFVYLTATMDAAIWGAELALGESPGRIYLVEPTGHIEDDPNLTDKKFPGNPTKSYRSRDPIRVIGEVADWQGHTPEQLKAMKDHLEQLKQQGVEAIEE